MTLRRRPTWPCSRTSVSLVSGASWMTPPRTLTREARSAASCLSSRCLGKFSHQSPSAKQQCKAVATTGQPGQRGWVALCPTMLEAAVVAQDSPEVQHGQLAPPQQASMASSSVGASSSSQAVVVACDDTLVAADIGGQHGQQRTLVDRPCKPADKGCVLLEGHLVRFDQHGQRGHTGSYEKMRSCCPLCHLGVRRILTAGFGEDGGLGGFGPFAFVGLGLGDC